MVAAVLALSFDQAHADDQVHFAMPVLGLTYSYAYLADTLGYWKQKGLDVSLDLIEGAATSKAMLAGDVEFAAAASTNLLAGAAHGQHALAIASSHDTLMVELTVSKQVAARSGLTVANSTVEQRARALKGLKISSDGPNTILDGLITYSARLGGFDPQKDITRVALPGTAVNAAMESGRIDGFSVSPPWSELAQEKGTGIIWISALRGDLPQLSPFAFSTIATRSDYCPAHPEICRDFLAGVKQAVDFMKQQPDKALSLLAPRFKGMDPAALKAAFDAQRAALTPGLVFDDKQWQITQQFTVETGIMKPDEALKQFQGVVYTNDYMPKDD